MFKKRNPSYILCRLLRKSMPERLAHLLLSRRGIPVKDLYKGDDNSTKVYLRAFRKVPELMEVFSEDHRPVIMEAGTGIYNPASAPFLFAGAKELILLEPYVGAGIDQERFNSRILSLMRMASEESFGVLPSPGIEVRPLEAIRLCQRPWEDTGLDDASLDLVLSASVLEHLRQPDVVIEECARIIKPGGWMINVVDMRDHFFKYPFEMLKYSERTWRILTTKHGGSGYQNRWRLSHWQETLARHGFDTQVIPLLRLPERLNKDKPYFHDDFKNLPDLDIVRATLVSQRR